MKLTDKQIDFDFIGTQEPLSVEDKNLISEYFKSKKVSFTLQKKKITALKRKKVFG